MWRSEFPRSAPNSFRVVVITQAGPGVLHPLSEPAPLSESSPDPGPRDRSAAGMSSSCSVGAGGRLPAPVRLRSRAGTRDWTRSAPMCSSWNIKGRWGSGSRFQPPVWEPLRGFQVPGPKLRAMDHASPIVLRVECLPSSPSSQCQAFESRTTRARWDGPPGKPPAARFLAEDDLDVSLFLSPSPCARGRARCRAIGSRGSVRAVDDRDVRTMSSTTTPRLAWVPR